MRHDGTSWTDPTEISDVRLLIPRAELLPGGEILLVGKHSIRQADGSTDLNALVVGEDGSPKRRFLLGDGIEDLQTTPEGKIWVSYDDQGTMGDFGQHGWGR